MNEEQAVDYIKSLDLEDNFGIPRTEDYNEEIEPEV